MRNTYFPPGPWPQAPVGELGAELVIGRSFGGSGLGFEIGCGGSTQTLQAHLQLHRLAALYLHTERHGEWLRRRLNPTGYDSRVVELGVDNGRLRWALWTKAGEWSSDTPRWRDGSIVIDPRERFLGPVTHRFADVGDPVVTTVRMPHGDDHDITLQLQRQTTGRARGRKFESWTVDWDSREGIPFRRDSWKGDGIYASNVEVSDAAVEQGTWPIAASAAIAEQMTRHRTDNNYRPTVAPEQETGG